MKIDCVSPIVEYDYMMSLTKALQIAHTNKKLSGTLECFILVLRGALKIGLILKYKRNEISNQ